MSQVKLNGIAQTVLHQAQANGFVAPRDVRAALTAACLQESLWKKVLEILGPSLKLRNGRYHFVPPAAVRMRVRARQDHDHLRAIRHNVRQLIRQYRKVDVSFERRDQARITLIQPVQAQTEDGCTLGLLTRDISATGLRLLGTHRLQGQKIRVWIPPPTDGRPAYCFLVQVLWSALVGDDLYENGGLFLEFLADQNTHA